MEEKKDLIRVLAANLAAERKRLGMTQAELAERLGYSDKSISKWERAEGLPDILCLKRMAELFNVTVDGLLSSDCGKTAPEEYAKECTEEISPGQRDRSGVNHGVITAIVIIGVWIAALLVHLIGWFCQVDLSLSLFVAIPVSALLLLIFNGLWGSSRFTFPTCSFFVVSLLFLLCWILRGYQVWLLMLLSLPAVLVVWLCCRIR